MNFLPALEQLQNLHPLFVHYEHEHDVEAHYQQELPEPETKLQGHSEGDTHTH